jgi:hypothetical protein
MRNTSRDLSVPPQDSIWRSARSRRGSADLVPTKANEAAFQGMEPSGRVVNFADVSTKHNILLSMSICGA